MAVKGGDSCNFLLGALGDDSKSKRLLVNIDIIDVIYQEGRRNERQRDKSPGGMILVVTGTSRKKKTKNKK